MYIIIIGCGKMGSMLAADLSDSGHSVCIIDRDKERLQTLGSGFNGLRLNGVEFDEEILLAAGIEKADIFISLSPDDTINLTSAQIAQSIYQVPRVIARINDPSKEKIFKQFNIESICPTKVTAKLLKEIIKNDKLHHLAIIDDDIEIIHFQFASKTEYNVAKFESESQSKVLSIKRFGKSFIPNDQDELFDSDILICSIKKDLESLILRFC